MSTWLIVGLALLAWAAYDIFTGTVWIHRKVSRWEEPILYWLCIGFYTIIGISCLIPF